MKGGEYAETTQIQTASVLFRSKSFFDPRDIIAVFHEHRLMLVVWLKDFWCVPLISRKKDGYIQVLHEDQPVSVLGDRYIPDSPLFADCSSLFRVKKRNLSGFVKGMSDRFAARIMLHTAILCPEGPDWLKLQPGSLVESDGSLYLIMDDENGRQMVPCSVSEHKVQGGFSRYKTDGTRQDSVIVPEGGTPVAVPELSYPVAGYLLPDDLPAARNTVRAAAENRTRFSQLIPPETLQHRKMADSAIPGDVFYSWMPLGDRALLEAGEGHWKRPYLIFRQMENGTLLPFPGAHKPKSGSCFAALPEQYPWYSLDHIQRPTVHITYFDISSPMYLEPRHLIERCFSLRTEHLQIVYRKAMNRTWCEKTGLSDWVRDRLVIETDDIVRYLEELFWVRKREKTTATLHPTTIPEGHGQPALFCQGKNVIPDTNASCFDACIGELDWMQTLNPAEALNWSEYLKLEREKKRKEDRKSGGNTKKARWKLEPAPGTIVS